MNLLAEPTHIPVYCSIRGCKEEAIRWFETEEDRSLLDIEEANIVYLCEDHNVINDGENFELAVYSCSEDCEVCNQ